MPCLQVDAGNSPSSDYAACCCAPALVWFLFAAEPRFRAIELSDKASQGYTIFNKLLVQNASKRHFPNPCSFPGLSHQQAYIIHTPGLRVGVYLVLLLSNPLQGPLVLRRQRLVIPATSHTVKLTLLQAN